MRAERWLTLWVKRLSAGLQPTAITALPPKALRVVMNAFDLHFQ